MASSLPCDQHSVGDCGPAPSLEGELGSSRTHPLAAGVGPWRILSWLVSGSHALQRLGFGFNQGTYIPLRPDVVALYLSVDYGDFTDMGLQHVLG